MSIQAASLIVLPTYNEVDSAPILINNILHFLPEISILVVDDNSQDGTLEAISRILEKVENNKVFFLERKSKLGLASAYKEGFRWGLDRDYKYIIEMDADGSHQVKDLHKMLVHIENDSSIDLLIGSRWIEGGSIVNWPIHRELLSRIANRFARMLLNLPVSDSTSGLRIISSSGLRNIDFSKMETVGYAFQIELVSEFTKSKYFLGEYPIEFIERRHGRSKMNGAIAIEAGYVILKWGWKRLLRIILSKIS